MDKKKTPDSVKRALAYELLSGYLEGGPPSEAIGEERAKLDALVDTIYQHRLRLCSRAGLDFEDKDLEGIVDAYEQMNRLVARLMYEQGQLNRMPSTQK